MLFCALFGCVIELVLCYSVLCLFSVIELVLCYSVFCLVVLLS